MMTDHIWEGVYQSFKEVPTKGEGFQSETWKANALERISELINRASSPATVPPVVVYKASLLPFLSALVYAKNGAVRILDFGGGVGFTYVPVIAAMPDASRVEYNVVDTPNICEIGEQVFSEDCRIHFSASLPEELEKVDIVHLGSSLQYIEGWRALLERLARYRPDYFLFTDLIAGDIPTYITAQNYYSSKIPYWFFNIHEVIEALASIHYRLLFKSTYVNTYLGVEQKCPQENFPEELRLGDTSALLFGSKAV